MNAHLHIEDDPSTSPTEAAPGRGGRLIAGRYAVQHTIARGGMGEVLLARHVHLGRFVAVKVLDPPRHAAATIDFAGRFDVEAKLLATLDHPHIVTIYDYGMLADGRGFLAMEHVAGPRMADLILEGAVPADQLVPLMIQAADALDHAHAHGVVHCDLKPANLLIRRSVHGQDMLKIVDFGIACNLTERGHDGPLLGSPHSVAPEQILGDPIDGRTDLYALGVLMFRALTGHHPFIGESVRDLLRAHVSQPVPWFSEVTGHACATPELEAIVRRCLAKDPAERFDTAGQLAQALQRVHLGGDDLDLPDPEPATFAHDTAHGPRGSLATPRLQSGVDHDEITMDLRPMTTAARISAQLMVSAVAAAAAIAIVAAFGGLG